MFIRVSKDAGRTWSRSVMLPLDGLYSLAAVESATVRPDGRCLLFLSAATRPGAPSRPLVYRSTEDGTSFHFLSFVTPIDESRYGGLNQMYPRGLMLPSGRLLCTLRLDRDWAGDMWTELYRSDDGGRTWGFPLARERLRRTRRAAPDERWPTRDRLRIRDCRPPAFAPSSARMKA